MGIRFHGVKLHVTPLHARKLRLMPQSLHWRAIWAMALSSATSGITTGLVPAVISLNLQERGLSTTMIGVNSAMPYVALLCLGPFLPHLIRILGTMPALIMGIVGNAAVFMAFPFVSSTEGWFLLRFLFGVFNAFPWMISEIWINRVADDRIRGRALALYISLWGLGVAFGPQIIAIVGHRGFLPFAIAMLLMVAATLPPLMARRLAPDIAQYEHKGFVREVMRNAPLALFAAFAGGAGEVTVFSMFPIYAGRVWDSPYVMTAALTVFASGGFLLQLPGGWVADRIGRRPFLLLYAAFSAMGAALLPILAGTSLLWPVIFIWGGVVIGMYSAGLMLLGDAFSHGDMAGANTAYAMAYTAGSIVGPIVAGYCMKTMPGHGFTLSMLVLFSLLSLLCAMGTLRHGMAR